MSHIRLNAESHALNQNFQNVAAINSIRCLREARVVALAVDLRMIMNPINLHPKTEDLNTLNKMKVSSIELEYSPCSKAS